MDELKRQQILSRIWEQADFGGEGCWEWQGVRTHPSYAGPGGYGVFSALGVTHSTSWWVYFLLHGWQGVRTRHLGDVMHTCHNAPCIRPSHLKLGSHRENIQENYSRAGSNYKPILGPRLKRGDFIIG